jgi:hypothetical protein
MTFQVQGLKPGAFTSYGSQLKEELGFHCIWKLSSACTFPCREPRAVVHHPERARRVVAVQVECESKGLKPRCQISGARVEARRFQAQLRVSQLHSTCTQPQRLLIRTQVHGRRRFPRGFVRRESLSEDLHGVRSGAAAASVAASRVFLAPGADTRGHSRAAHHLAELFPEALRPRLKCAVLGELSEARVGWFGRSLAVVVQVACESANFEPGFSLARFKG